MRARAGLAFDSHAGRGSAAKRRVDRHIGADPVTLEAERLEQHAGAGVGGVDAGPEIAGDRAGEEQVGRADLARAFDHCADELFAQTGRLTIGVYDHEHEPRGDVITEALRLHDRGAVLVAEDLVGERAPSGLASFAPKQRCVSSPTVSFSSGIAAEHNAASASGVTG